ncbi:hypothetical protein HD554DRAFT_1688139 [Boletus coccyginus]|nr:hypothetical protein HD554DRAFT_1688139 [Boletus coccyginus]
MLFNKLVLMLLGIVAAAAASPTNIALDTVPPGVTKRTSDDFAKRAADADTCGFSGDGHQHIGSSCGGGSSELQ